MRTGKLIDLTGQRFGKLEVVERSEDHISKGGYASVMWLCKCDCGGKRIAYGQALRNGSVVDCGCGYKRDQPIKNKYRATTHGESKTKLYRIWSGMKTRCSNPHRKEYPLYGGNGITVCEEWQRFENFREWAFEHGYDPSSKQSECTLDRIDPNKGYNPTNCRFADMQIQNRNKRNNRIIEYNGKSQCLSEWANEYGIKAGTLRERLEAGIKMEIALIPRKLTNLTRNQNSLEQLMQESPLMK